jgi:hypothetical protein
MTLTGNVIDRVVNGKAVERRMEMDTLNQMQQPGVIPPLFQQLGDRWGQKTRQRVKKKEREVSRNFSALSRGIDHAGNAFEKMIDQWGQVSLHAHLSPLVFEV